MMMEKGPEGWTRLDGMVSVSHGGVSSRGWCSPFLRPLESPFSFSLETPWR